MPDTAETKVEEKVTVPEGEEGHDEVCSGGFLAGGGGESRGSMLPYALVGTEAHFRANRSALYALTPLVDSDGNVSVYVVMLPWLNGSRNIAPITTLIGVVETCSSSTSTNPAIMSFIRLRNSANFQ